MEERLRSLENDALEFANTLRDACAMPLASELTPGFRRRSDACTVASTANAGRPGRDRWEVGPRGAILVGPLGGQKCPPVLPSESVVEFFAAYDAGMYPQLDRESVPTLEGAVA